MRRHGGAAGWWNSLPIRLSRYARQGGLRARSAPERRNGDDFKSSEASTHIKQPHQLSDSTFQPTRLSLPIHEVHKVKDLPRPLLIARSKNACDAVRRSLLLLVLRLCRWMQWLWLFGELRGARHA